jgi:hypothetical protein
MLKIKEIATIDYNTIENSIVIWRYNKQTHCSSLKRYHLSKKNTVLFMGAIHKRVNTFKKPIEICHHYDSNIGQLTFHLN